MFSSSLLKKKKKRNYIIIFMKVKIFWIYFKIYEFEFPYRDKSK